jgi:hypothetical protein
MKKKWASAEAKRNDSLLTESWKLLKEAHGVVEEDRRRKRAMAAEPYVPPVPAFREATLPRIPSRITAGGSCARPEDKVYTGTAVLGIAQMAKSNAVPVFSTQEIVDIGRMRRG